jgi:hypothetical protein
MEDAIEVMKLLCYEMMESNQRQAAAPGNGAVVQELLVAQADRLVGIMAGRTHEVRAGMGWEAVVSVTGCEPAVGWGTPVSASA